MTVTEAVQETAQSVTGAAQHAIEEAKAHLPQKEPPCKFGSNHDPHQLDMLRNGRKGFVICLFTQYDFNMANNTFYQLALHREQQCPKRGYPSSIEIAALIS